MYPAKETNYNIYNAKYKHDYYYVIILYTSVYPIIMLFEYMVMILLCDESLCMEYAMLASKMSYKKMLRIAK